MLHLACATSYARKPYGICHLQPAPLSLAVRAHNAHNAESYANIKGQALRRASMEKKNGRVLLGDSFSVVAPAVRRNFAL